MKNQKKPNLFIIGAMKSGTSSLHAYLDEHPKICMSSEKEPGYFLDEFTWSKGEDWYLSLFSCTSDVRYMGESSTHYTKIPRFQGALGRLYTYNPDARLIYIMRDPIRRIISHYWHMVISHDESRDMLTAVKEDPQYGELSNYAMQLKPYLDTFPRDQIYTMTFEALIADPHQQLHLLFDWLGVDPAFRSENVGDKYNVGAKRFTKPRQSGLLNRFRFSPTWDKLSWIVPKPVRTLGTKMAVREYDRSSQPLEPVIEYLRPSQLEHTEHLADLLGREFPEWTTVYNQQK